MSEIMKAAADLLGQGRPTVREWLGGVQAVWTFPNGYGASVVHNPYSYGVELAVLHHGSIAYDTSITDDVVGHISSPEELAELLRQIHDLPAH